jgi:hypothetical protein
MKQFLRSCFLLIVACVALAPTLRAQTVLYSSDFPNDQGWTFTSSGPGHPWWAVDATPATVLGTPSWHSAPFSLNFNNGVDYTPQGLGTATSPQIDLSAASGNVWLTFWCNWHTEWLAPWDERTLEISNDGFQTLLFSKLYFSSCAPAGQWHLHSEPLSTSWGTIQLRFFFGAYDFYANNYEGWFVDDLTVNAECVVDAPYCTPKVNSQGCSPGIYTTGTPSLSGSGTAFRIWAGNVLNQKVGLMLWSRSPASTPFAGGTLCVAAPITRTSAQNSGGTSLPAQDCTGTYVLQFTPAMMSQAGLVVGDDIYSQYWSRDNGFPPPDNVGLTAGVHWSVCP